MVLSAAGPGWKESSQPGGRQNKVGQAGLRRRSDDASGLSPAHRTHRAITPTSQNPQIMDFAVHFQPGPGKTGRVRRHAPQSEPCSPLSPRESGKHSRFPGSSLAQIEDLPGVQIPQKRLDDLSALQGQPKDNEGTEVKSYQR